MDDVNHLLGFRDNGHDGLTCGSFEDEVSACEALDDLLERIGWWKIYREVPGRLLHPRPEQQSKGFRADRILIPLDERWPLGIVGIECKRSGEKLGPPLAQLLDYSHAAFEIKPGFWVMPQWWYLWPMRLQHGPLASMLNQNRLGGVVADRWWSLQFHSGNFRLAAWRSDGSFHAGGQVNVGRRAGSR